MIDVILLTQAQTLLLAMAVFFIGTYLHGKFDFLKRYNIPEPVIGGIFASVVLAVIAKWGSISTHFFPGQNFFRDSSFVFDKELYNDLMLTFFATVGLSAKFSFFKKGGKKIFIFLVVAGAFLVLQNLRSGFFVRRSSF